jgi:hypothetical protein
VAREDSVSVEIFARSAGERGVTRQGPVRLAIARESTYSERLPLIAPWAKRLDRRSLGAIRCHSSLIFMETGLRSTHRDREDLDTSDQSTGE